MRSNRYDDATSSAATPASAEITPGQRSRVDRAASGPIGAAPDEAVARASGSAGAPLPSPLEERLSGALNADLSGVRVHDGGASAGAAQDLGARAFTVGQDIHFGAGQFDPGSKDGQHLIAHEVAHTVQQGAAADTGPQCELEVSSPGDAHEVEADSFADSFVEGGATTSMSPVGRGTVSRKVMRVPIPADIQAMDLTQCRTLVTNIYKGEGDYANNGIFHYKLDACDATGMELSRSDPTSLTTTILLGILSVGVAAGAAALAVAFPGALAAAVIAGGAGVITVLPTIFMASDPSPVNVAGFIQKYKLALRRGWLHSADSLLARMTTEGTARQIAADTRDAHTRGEVVQQNQKNELLDEWLNAINHATHSGGASTFDGLGRTSVGDSTDGRLSLFGMYLSHDRWRDPTGGNIEGLPNQDLRDSYLGRTVGSISIARTMRGMTEWGEIALYWKSDGQQGLSYEDSNATPYRTMASFYLGRELDANDMGWFEGDSDDALIDANWMNGVRKAWDNVKDKTVRELTGERGLPG